MVIAAQDHVGAVDQRYLGAEFVEDARELVGDIARARDQDTLRDRVEVERLVRGDAVRSEEHTSELQSLMRISYAVFCLKKKTIKRLLALYNLKTEQQQSHLSSSKYITH